MLAVALGACQTLVITPSLSELLVPLDRALASKPDELETAAASGDGEAQFGLSLVWGYGLYGYPVDMNKAAELRAKALSNRRFVPITLYTAAFNGQPSRVNIINVPTYDLTQAEARAADACIAWLSEQTTADDACGGTQNAVQRQRLWGAASEQRSGRNRRNQGSLARSPST